MIILCLLCAGAVSGILQGFGSAAIRSQCSSMVPSNQQGTCNSLYVRLLPAPKQQFRLLSIYNVGYIIKWLFVLNNCNLCLVCKNTLKDENKKYFGRFSYLHFFVKSSENRKNIFVFYFWAMKVVFWSVCYPATLTIAKMVFYAFYIKS